MLALGAQPVVRLTPQARVIAAVLAIAFMALILELIRRRRLLPRYSIIWFLAGLGMLAGAAFPGLLRLLAQAMGVRDVTIALFSLLFILLLGLALYFSVIVSRQTQHITRLAQQAAIQTARTQRPGADGGRADETTGQERQGAPPEGA